MFGIFGCKNSKKDIVFEKFNEKLQQRGFKVDSVDNEGFVHVSRGEYKLSVSLENVRKDYSRDQNEESISNLVETVFASSLELSGWATSRTNIHFTFVPHDFDFGDLIHQKVTDEFSKVFVHYGTSNITFISRDQMLEWQVSEVDLEKQAAENAQATLEETNIKYEIIDGRKLGMIEAKRESLKPALLFAPKISEKVSKDIGFPFFAVIPVRDFCYIFSQKDFEFFAQRLGSTVVDEYKKSGYPITTEILKFTDKGVEAVGRYPVE
jgi:hypothetical protein